MRVYSRQLWAWLNICLFIEPFIDRCSHALRLEGKKEKENPSLPMIMSWMIHRISDLPESASSMHEGSGWTKGERALCQDLDWPEMLVFLTSMDWPTILFTLKTNFLFDPTVYLGFLPLLLQKWTLTRGYPPFYHPTKPTILIPSSRFSWLGFA